MIRQFISSQFVPRRPFVMPAAALVLSCCLLAGCSLEPPSAWEAVEGDLAHSRFAKPTAEIAPIPPEKTYEVDVRGFLTNPEQWDEQFAAAKAFEMKTPHHLFLPIFLQEGLHSIFYRLS